MTGRVSNRAASRGSVVPGEASHRMPCRARARLCGAARQAPRGPARLLFGGSGGDFAAPGAALGVAGFDQLLETLEIGAYASLVETGSRADGFGHVLGLIAERETDQRARRAPLLEGDGSSRLLSVFAYPTDLPVRVFLGDLRVPLSLPAGDRH